MSDNSTIQAMRKINKGLVEQRNYSDEYYFGQFKQQEENLEALEKQNAELKKQRDIAVEALEDFMCLDCESSSGYLQRCHKSGEEALKQIKGE